MIYKQLKIGDKFVICREHDCTLVYMKHESFFEDVNTRKAYRPLNALTKVRLVK